MTEEGKDKHDIKQQQECLNETLTVLPEAKKRLEKYAIELDEFLIMILLAFYPLLLL